jgi:hypothetical protein
VGVPGWAGGVLRLHALLTAAAGVLLLSGTWDALYSVLDLPHRGPALLAQLGGAGLLALAYLLWIAPRSLELARTVALPVAVASGMGAVIIAAWLIVRTNTQLAIGTQGVVELAVAAVTLAALAVADARIAALPGESSGPRRQP